MRLKCFLLLAAFIVVDENVGVPLKNYLKSDVTEDLLSVVVLYRHGDRAPSTSYPSDPYFNESYWPMGYGQLTKKGKDRLYHLGKWFRKRYNTFLPQKYSPKDMYARSTNIDRCLMSAALVLAGLYFPKKTDLFNPDLPWLPIPVHTKPPYDDEVLSMRKECKRYRSTYHKAMEDDFFKNLPSIYFDFYDYISQNTGLEKVTLTDIGTLQTNLDCYASYNSSFIPEWSKHLSKETLEYLAGVAHERYTHNLELKRLLTGPFWRNLIEFFDETVEGADVPKFVMLSGHDTTLVSLLNGMGVYDLVPPVFGATLIWELREREGEVFVRVLYKRSGPDVEVLEVKGCGKDCNYKEFRKVLEPITVDLESWEVECQNEGYLEVPKRTGKVLDSNREFRRNHAIRPFAID